MDDCHVCVNIEYGQGGPPKVKLWGVWESEWEREGERQRDCEFNSIIANSKWTSQIYKYPSKFAGWFDGSRQFNNRMFWLNTQPSYQV